VTRQPRPQLALPQQLWMTQGHWPLLLLLLPMQAVATAAAAADCSGGEAPLVPAAAPTVVLQGRS
jgi:hypothetical protein